MVEIEANKEIKNIKQEYFFGLGLKELVLGVVSIVISAVLYRLLPFAGMTKGYICMTVVIVLMFIFNYKIYGMTLFRHLLCLINSIPYINKPLLFKDDNVKERGQIKKNG